MLYSNKLIKLVSTSVSNDFKSFRNQIFKNSEKILTFVLENLAENYEATKDDTKLAHMLGLALLADAQTNEGKKTRDDFIFDLFSKTTDISIIDFLNHNFLNNLNHFETLIYLRCFGHKMINFKSSQILIENCIEKLPQKIDYTLRINGEPKNLFLETEMIIPNKEYKKKQFDFLVNLRPQFNAEGYGVADPYKLQSYLFGMKHIFNWELRVLTLLVFKNPSLLLSFPLNLKEKDQLKKAYISGCIKLKSENKGKYWEKLPDLNELI